PPSFCSKSKGIRARRSRRSRTSRSERSGRVCTTRARSSGSWAKGGDRRMKRLRDESVADALLARGIDILRSTTATPSMPDARRRVWLALEAGIAGARRHEAVNFSPFRMFALVVALLLAGGTAGAVLGRRLIVPLLERAASTARSVLPEPLS